MTRTVIVLVVGILAATGALIVRESAPDPLVIVSDPAQCQRMPAEWGYPCIDGMPVPQSVVDAAA